MKNDDPIDVNTQNGDDPTERSFWEANWQNGTTGWDIGFASPPIVEYMQSFQNKDAAILIPGCGNAYEAVSLVAQGFTNITLIDIAPKAVENLKISFGDHPAVKVYCEDFFQHEGAYDLMIEQTFFCAIPPVMRTAYVIKTAELLKQGGKLAGVLFDRTFEKQGPPFGGFADEYKLLFEPYFEISKMERCYNSIAPRRDKELFIEMHNMKLK